jgi:class 3 adenylate cyclase/tetratricopeptide (TPR) repeat protein
MTCPTCGSENKAGRKFCSNCGSGLARACPTCGAANEPDDRFCGECGAALDAAGAMPMTSGPEAERRLVSVLFADLVGFTPLSENRDPEEVRELLSRYFDTARQVIGRYGGTVEKFIGDAVMAVWGTPIAREDDAERAARAALELVEVVAALGGEVGAEGLGLRAGVVTGEAAVTVGAEGQGMVAGDLVNTASRVQSVAEAGSVLVNERTRRASEAAIAYEDAGSHELKGKAEALPLWRALRVIAARRGEGRASSLEAPFVGRDGELRLIKDLFHATAEERKARLVSVVGIAGIGKTRVSWEFEKYVDGLVDNVYWHRGRCLAYGDGVAYWALAEMVRRRAGIAEQEEPASARAKLRATVEEHLGDPEERAWVEPRVGQLLGLTDQAPTEREDLYAGWRLFFERLAEKSPTVLVFEDLQWADKGLLDFIEYLLDWARSHPLYVVTLARPELAERRQNWGGGRNFTSIGLEPLSDGAMDELLAGLAPGLPEELRTRICERAEGVPLYAIETVRMLLDRGHLRQENGGFVASGEIESLEVPETLHALIAARLDGLDPGERRVVEDASVLGKTFDRAGLAALTGAGEDELDALLASLVRKDVLSVQADPRSPERGQYGFLQALVQKIAHETLSRKERKTRHLAVARHLEESWGSEEAEIVEVVASHYLDAYRSDPDAADAEEIRAKARETLAKAGHRAASVAATQEAQRYFEQAAELAEEEPRVRAELLEEAGAMASASTAGSARGVELFEQSSALFTEEGLTHPAARVEAKLAQELWDAGQIDTAAERMQRSYDVLSGDEPDADLAALAAQLGRFLYFTGKPEEAAPPIEFALEIAESLGLPTVLSQALNTKHLILASRGRSEEAQALIGHALEIALEHDLTNEALRGYFNLSYRSFGRDRYEEAMELDERGRELARRRGYRAWEHGFLGHLRGGRLLLGDWDDLLPTEEELAEISSTSHTGWLNILWVAPTIHFYQGRPEELQRIVSAFPAEPSAEVQEMSGYDFMHGVVARAEGRPADALGALGRIFERLGDSPEHPFLKAAFSETFEAAFDLGELEAVERRLDWFRALRPADQAPFLAAQAARAGARLAVVRGQSEGVEPGYKRAAALLREISARFWLGVTLGEHGEWLVAAGRRDEAEPLLTEAREIFARVGAAPWLERLDALVDQRTLTEA